MDGFYSDDRPTCPFCPYTVPSREKIHMWELLQHLEYTHPENERSPFYVPERPASRGSSRAPRSPSVLREVTSASSLHSPLTPPGPPSPRRPSGQPGPPSPRGPPSPLSPPSPRAPPGPRTPPHPLDGPGANLQTNQRGPNSPRGIPVPENAPTIREPTSPRTPTYLQEPGNPWMRPQSSASWSEQRPRPPMPRHSSYHSTGNMKEGASRSRGTTPTRTSELGDYYVECPLEDCGEALHIRELDYHMDLHDSENMAMEASDRSRSRSISRSPRRLSPQSSTSKHSLRPPKSRRSPAQQPSPARGRQKEAVPFPIPPSRIPSPSPPRRWSSSHALQGLKGLLLGPAPRKTRSHHNKSGVSARRLGTEELGPFAFEDKMPLRVRQQLERGAEVHVSNEIGANGEIIRVERVANEIAGIIPVLARLCRADSSLSKVFLCHPSTKHIFKMPREGGFCGYRNIQMLVSFLQGTQFPGSEYFPGRTPTIFKLQDMIEDAWDRGFDNMARFQTGGIRGTRKYIGTPEAQALFNSLDIGCEANAFSKPADKSSDQPYVHGNVLEAVFQYFSTGVRDPQAKVYETGLAPIYFQHPGHSMTIIGLEVRKSGLMNLLVFDPMFKTPPPIVSLIGSKTLAAPPKPRRLIKPFRRGDPYLKQYRSFEILKLTAITPSVMSSMPEVEKLEIGDSDLDV